MPSRGSSRQLCKLNTFLDDRTAANFKLAFTHRSGDGEEIEGITESKRQMLHVVRLAQRGSCPFIFASLQTTIFTSLLIPSCDRFPVVGDAIVSSTESSIALRFA